MTFPAVLLAAIGVRGWRYAHREADLVGAPLQAERIPDSAPGNNLLVFPDTVVPADQPVPGWHIHLGNHYRQMAAWGLVDGRPGWNLQSRRANELWIASPLISVAPEMILRNTIRHQFYRCFEEGFCGAKF